LDWIIQFNFRQNLIFLLKPYPTKLGADTGFFQGYDIIHNIHFFMDWIGLDWIGLDWIGLDWIVQYIGRQNHISFAKAIPHKMIRYMIHMIFFLSK